jgi:PKD repeat protein
MRKMAKTLRLLLLCLLTSNTIWAQSTLFSEDFETGGNTFTLNTTDLGGTNTPNFWVINNAYTGGAGSLMCLGFPFTYTIANTPTQTFHGNTTSNYLHTMSIYGQADNIFCSSFAAADGLCILNSTNICKTNTAINTVGFNNVALKFWWNCAGGTNIYGEVYYSVNGGTTWTLLTTPVSQYKNQTNWVQQTITLPAFNGVADLRFAFRFVNNQSNSALDPGFSIDDIVVEGTPMSSQTVTTGTVSNLSVCAGQTVQVPYSITGAFTVGNVFTAQLSDASGSFLLPTPIGSVTSTSAGAITATIPPGTPAGTGYRIRVVASTPATIGTANVSNITVLGLPVAGVAFVTGNTTVCQGSTVQITLQGFSGTFEWQSSPNGTTWTNTGQSSNPLLSTLSAVTYFRAIVFNNCDTVYSQPVVISVVSSNNNFAQGILSRDSLCTGDTTTVQMIYWGSSITWYTSSNGGATWNFSANSHPDTYHTPPLNGANQNMVRAIVDNGPCGFDTIDVAIAVENIASAFTESHIGLVYAFTDASTNAVSWAWDFGDGNTSTQQNPLHSYAVGGNYTVTLTVTGPFGCTATTTQSISIPVGMEDPNLVGISIFPNPFGTEFWLEMQLPTTGIVKFTLLDLTGRTIAVHEEAADAGKLKLHSAAIAPNISSGSYCLKVQTNDGSRTMRIVKF